jgi:glycosyl transferase family 1
VHIVFRGNFGVSFSTESHVAASMEALGHTVVRLQEQLVSWPETLAACEDADVFWWTQTRGYALNWDENDAHATLARIGERIPTVGFHLDRWVGLEREHQLGEDAFFRVQHLFTADGDNQDVFDAHGINHLWSPPAVYGAECVPGTPQRRYASDVAFVGNWRGGYHDEWWPARKRMLDFVRRTYRNRAVFWPRGRAVRGQDLNDLYASVKVVVGDSCFADRSRFYMSDRLFETVGRGGFLIFPHIEKAADMLVDGEHCRFYPWGDHAELKRIIDYYLAHDDERNRIRAAGQAFVRDNHTYAHRVQAILDVVMSERVTV